MDANTKSTSVTKKIKMVVLFVSIIVILLTLLSFVLMATGHMEYGAPLFIALQTVHPQPP